MHEEAQSIPDQLIDSKEDPLSVIKRSAANKIYVTVESVGLLGRVDSVSSRPFDHIYILFRKKSVSL